MIQFLRFAAYVGLAFVFAPVAIVAAVGDALTDGRFTGWDYTDPYNAERQCAERQYPKRPGGGCCSKD